MTRRPLIRIIVPAFNERDTIAGVVKRLAALPVTKQIIVVDDASTDEGLATLGRHARKALVVRHATNRGKGAAVRTGLALAKGQWTIVQDADDETDPMDIVRLLKLARSRNALIAFGSRYKDGNLKTWWRSVHRRPGLILTRTATALINGWTNLLYGTRYTDVPCVYKLIPTDLLKQVKITSHGFDIEAELAAKMAPYKERLVERRITYTPRQYVDGKKIRPWDTVRILWTITRLRFSRTSTAHA